MSFSADLEKFNKKAIDSADDIRQGVVSELFNSVILDTPIDTGRARANWQASIGTPKSGVVDRAPAAAVAEIENNLGEGDVTNFLTNNLPYIERLEEGSSKQAPAGMVRKNIARISRIIKRAAR